MNKFDLEQEQFMKVAEKDCHKYKRTDIEQSPYLGVWLHQWWLLTRIQRYLSDKTGDPRNLIRDCRKQGVTDPRLITQDELCLEFFVCKQNLDHLAKHGPYYHCQFLKRLVTLAKLAGNANRAAKISVILHQEASRKQ
jgi:hypothetical protein